MSLTLCDGPRDTAAIEIHTFALHQEPNNVPMLFPGTAKDVAAEGAQIVYCVGFEYGWADDGGRGGFWWSPQESDAVDLFDNERLHDEQLWTDTYHPDYWCSFRFNAVVPAPEDNSEKSRQAITDMIDSVLCEITDFVRDQIRRPRPHSGATQTTDN